MGEVVLSGPHKDFEGIKKVDENGVEYWQARELLPPTNSIPNFSPYIESETIVAITKIPEII